MSRIDDMLREMCPDGVEYKPLGEVGKFFRGSGLLKKDFVDEGLPCIHYGQIHTRFRISTDSTISFVTPELWSRLHHAASGDLLIATTSEDDAAVAKATAWLGEGEVAVGGDLHIFRHVLDPKYVSHFFSSTHFQNQKSKFISGAKVRRISSTNLSKIRIPVPPIEIQREIVLILDKFVKLEAELEAELDLRQKQYKYYLELLLTVAEYAPQVRLGDISKIVRGASPRPIYKFLAQDSGGIPWIKIGDVPANGKYVTKTEQFITPDGVARSRRIHPGDFLLSNSMSFGRPYISNIDGCIHDGWLAIRKFQDTFSPDYLYYALRSAKVQQEFESRAGSSTVKNLNADIVRSISIPAPPRQEQDRIVEILNLFDVLVSDISLGLPAEIAARRQQYEYYRDKLLTFPQKAV